MKLRFLRQAAKIDYLEKQPGFAQTPEGKAGIHMLRTRYPESADKAFPLLFREYKRGMESGGQQGIVIAPSYLQQHRMMEAYREQNPRHAEHYKAILEGDRPDAYFWKMKQGVDGPQYHPVQPGMMQNLARMLKWMKGANQPLPNMDSKATTLEHVEQLYNDWRAKYDRDRDPHLGTVAHAFPDSWTMRTCDNPEECYDEGEEMNHCGAKYAPLVQSGTHALYSLRDPDNRPHASFVYRPDEHTIEDIRGKSNQPVNSTYLSYLQSYFPLMGEGLTISGHPDPQAPPIPEVNQYGLPVVGAEAERQGDRIARILGYPVEQRDNERLGWVIEADKLNDFLRGKVYKTQPCETCGGKRFVEDPETGKRGRCPACHGKGAVPVLDDKGEPVLDRYYYPEFSDPNHPEYPTASPVLNELEKQYHSEQNDQLFPFLVNQYKRGQLRMVPGQEQEHYNPDLGRYEMRPGEPRFEHAISPDEHSDRIQEWIRGHWGDNLGPNEVNTIQRTLDRYDDDDWDYVRGPEWKPLDRDTVDSYGQWLSDTTSQHPSRHGLTAWDSRANNGEGDFVPHPQYPHTFDLNNATFNELEARKKAYDEWLEAKNSVDRAIFKSADGKHHMVELRPDECRKEGTHMQNCITGYGGALESGKSMIYSLRDKNGKPHLDMELQPKTYYNKDTREELSKQEYQELKRKATAGRVTCPECNGGGYPVLDRDAAGHPTRYDYDNGYCPTCHGNCSVPGEGDEEAAQRLKGFSPSPLDADVIQIQGKNNKPALPQYQAPVKEFFSKFPQDRLPKWKLDKTHFTDFGNMFGEDGHPIYYHPGDYGLPDPGITTDYPSLVRSYMATGNEEDSTNRRRADYLVNRWAKGHGELDQLREALGHPNILDSVKQQAARHFNPHDTDEMREWEAANPDPRANWNNPHPEWFDAEGNYRDDTPEFQQEMAAWEQREQEAWRANEAWQHQRDQMASQVRDQYAGDAYTQLPAYKRWEYANTLANGQELAVPRVDEDLQVIGSVRNVPEWCRCGTCDPEWDMVRVANEQLWNKVRNMLRKNNIANDANLGAWEHLKKLYPDAAHLGEFLHREFRKGRLRMPESELAATARSYEERAKNFRQQANEAGEGSYHYNRYLQRAEEMARIAEQYRDRANQEEWEPGDKPFTIPGFNHPDHRNGELTPEVMQHLIEEVKKQGQREKGWNIMKQEVAPLAGTAAEAAASARRAKFSGQPVYTAPPESPHAGWSVRYLDTPESAKNEKEMMRHCVDKYGDRILASTTHNYSIRDPENKSHRTLEFLKDQEPEAGMHNVVDANNHTLDWDKIRGVMGHDWDVDKHQQAVEGFLNGDPDYRQQSGTRAWDTFGHDYANETRNFLREARGRGGIEAPTAFPDNWRVYQNTGSSGMGVGGDTQSFIREWMNSLPWDQRPIAMRQGNYYDTPRINNPHDLFNQQPEQEGQPVDEWGFRQPEGGGNNNNARIRWDNVALGLQKNPRYDIHGYDLGEGDQPYDPEVGQKTYEWARDNNHLKDFYNAVGTWEKNQLKYEQPNPRNTRPVCPECNDRYDVRPYNDGDEYEWNCTYCRHPFNTNGTSPRQYQRYGPQYNEYQQAAVQHLAPLFAQHPELVADATAPKCPSCGNAGYVEPRGDGSYYCGWCGRTWRQPQASFNEDERNYVPHFASDGRPCRCPWHVGPPTNMGDFEVVANSDWGEDADSGLGEPEPAWDYAPAHEQESVIPCPVCQDPMQEGQCRRCDWGDWGREQPTPNPHDPVRDLKSPVQS